MSRDPRLYLQEIKDPVDSLRIPTERRPLFSADRLIPWAFVAVVRTGFVLFS